MMIKTVFYRKICYRCFHHRHLRFHHRMQKRKYFYHLFDGKLFPLKIQRTFSHYEYQEKSCVDSFQNLSSFNWLSEIGPGFPVNGNSITVLYEPAHFYNALQEKIKQTKNRITIASLYLGTSPLDQQLVNNLTNVVAKSKGDIEVLLLIDYIRGQRGNPNSCTMLLPLLKYKRVQIALYHTPQLRGILKTVLPDRWNELTGLQHMKLYLFDDSFLMSGANLSRDYYVNRQDRYIMIENCHHLSNYLHNVVSSVASFCFQLRENSSLSIHPSWKTHPFKDNEETFKLEAKEKVLSSIQHFPKNISNTYNQDTVVYPFLQMGPLGIQEDEQATKELLKRSSDGSQIVLASGYFNLTDVYKNIILKQSQAAFKFLMASPKTSSFKPNIPKILSLTTVNGFYGAHGPAGAVPSVYTYLAFLFYKQILQHQQQHRVRLLEYEQHGWTFHAKGIWYYCPNESLPSLSTIGSPNFGYRSLYRDLELQLIIITENIELRQKLHEEQAKLCSRSIPISHQTFLQNERQVPMWVKGVSRFFQDFF